LLTEPGEKAAIKAIYKKKPPLPEISAALEEGAYRVRLDFRHR
jgi:hypothetical protein